MEFEVIDNNSNNYVVNIDNYSNNNNILINNEPKEKEIPNEIYGFENINYLNNLIYF